MVINPSCSCVDAAGLIHLDGLRNWTHVRAAEAVRRGAAGAAGGGPTGSTGPTAPAAPQLPLTECLCFLTGSLQPLAVGVRDGAGFPEGHAPLHQVCCRGARAR